MTPKLVLRSGVVGVRSPAIWLMNFENWTVEECLTLGQRSPGVPYVGGSSHSIEIADQEDADGWTVKASLLQTSGGSEDCQGLGERPFMLIVVNTLAVMGFS